MVLVPAFAARLDERAMMLVFAFIMVSERQIACQKRVRSVHFCAVRRLVRFSPWLTAHAAMVSCSAHATVAMLATRDSVSGTVQSFFDFEPFRGATSVSH